MKNFITKDKIKVWMQKTGVVAFWFAIWQIIYILINQEMLLVSPFCVFNRLIEVLFTTDFWHTMSDFILRLIIGLSLGIFLGVLSGIFCFFSKIINLFLEPVVKMIKSIPIASLTLILVVFLKSEIVPIFIMFLTVFPIFFNNIKEGLFSTEKSLLQMARIYNFGFLKTFLNIYIHNIKTHFSAALKMSLGFSIKTAITAEIIASVTNSFGEKIYYAKATLNSLDLWTYTCIIIIIGFALESLFFSKKSNI